ncbi:MAG: AAA family ATPase, partial [Desulfobulbia bacterium]
MSIITISRGSYSRGKEVAESLASKLNYDCVSREIILEASREFDIPEIKLMRALQDPVSILDRFHNGKERYVNFFRSALLNYLKKDNVLYHGLAGHFFLQDIPRVLKVRINTNIEDRVREEMMQENISSEQARYMLIKDDEERRKWGLHLYGRDTSDSKYYDMVINLTQVSVDDAVQTLYDVSQRPAFQVTVESKKLFAEAALIADIKARIFEYVPKPSITIENGVVQLHNIDEQGSKKPLLKSKIEEVLG